MEVSGSFGLNPTAQDFHLAFGLSGEDDRHISVIDEQGVALAAIHGLDQKVERQHQALARKLKEQESQIAARDAEIQQLEQTVAELKRIVSQLPHQN